MKDNYTKKLFEMNKFFIISFFIVANFFIAKDVFAISGACSSHNGVNCSIGSNYFGYAVCNDGWTSMTKYSETDECKVQSCKEWFDLLNKYNINGLYNQMQNVTNKMSNNVLGAFDLNLANQLQIQYNGLKSQYNSAYSQAVTECSALGSIESDNRKLEQTKQDYYRAQIKANDEAIARLKEEQRKSSEDYQNTINNLNTQNICPLNSTFNGTNCACNKGYLVYNNSCVASTDYCKLTYGDHIFANETNCVCESGYTRSNSRCIKIETEPIQSIQSPQYPTKDIRQKTINHRPIDTTSANDVQMVKEQIKEQSPPKEEEKKATTTIIKEEVKKSDTDKATVTPQDTEIKEKSATVQEKQNLVSKVVGFVKGIFSKFFK